ncbi:hypothetical protein Tco_0809036 [Tanacetum coccineum]
MFSIIYEPVHGIIYKNSKKEKRVMRHSEIHKFCDATLNRVLECLKSYNNGVSMDLKQSDLIEDEHHSTPPESFKPESPKPSPEASTKPSSWFDQSKKPKKPKKSKKSKKSKKLNQSPKPSYSGSSSDSSLAYKDLDDFLANDGWNTHEEGAASYVDLHAKLATVSETLEADSKLKTRLQTIVNTNIRTFDNITNLSELLRNGNVTGVMTRLDALQKSFNILNAQQATLSDSCQSLAWNLVIDPAPEVTPPKPTVLETQVGSSSFTIPKINNGKGRAKKTDDSPPKLVKALRTLHPDLDAPVHNDKLRKKAELKKKMYDDYVWIVNNRMKPRKITNIQIHPRLKPISVTIYKNNDKRDFEVHKVFRFGDFSLSEWDKLGVILSTKANQCVPDMLNSISKKYEILKEIAKTLNIDEKLPLPEQDPSLPSN